MRKFKNNYSKLIWTLKIVSLDKFSSFYIITHENMSFLHGNIKKDEICRGCCDLENHFNLYYRVYLHEVELWKQISSGELWHKSCDLLDTTFSVFIWSFKSSTLSILWKINCKVHARLKSIDLLRDSSCDWMSTLQKIDDIHFIETLLHKHELKM